VKAAPPDAEKTASGLASKVLTKGTGTEHPAAADIVEVHYTAGPPTGRCSTAPWRAAARRSSRSTR
jgi:peptidylprolyl isomerase